MRAELSRAAPSPTRTEPDVGLLHAGSLRFRKSLSARLRSALEPSARRAFALTLIFMASGLLLAACGLANGAGLVGHGLYEDEVAICRYCAEEGELCAELDNGSWGCRPFADLQGCAAADNLFFEHEAEGPFLSPVRGRTDLDEGLRSDCADGKNPYIADVLVYDFELDTDLSKDWNIDEDDPELAERVLLTDVDQNVHEPSAWDAQAYYSSDGNDVTYRVEITFCMSIVFEHPVALQVADKRGHHSNAICLDPPG